MLPLHNPARDLTLLILLAVPCLSCSDKPKTDLAVIEALSESIETSNKSLESANSDIMASLNQKLSDPATGERAKYWLLRTEKVQSLSRSIYDKIEKLKPTLDKELRIKRDKSLDLYEALINYKKEVLKIDSQITHTFEKSIVVFTSSLNFSNDKQRDLFGKYFDGASVSAARAMLSKLQNNIRVNENKLLLFCHERIGTRGGRCTFISPIVGQSSTIVQPGERLEIFAGIGEFYPDVKAEMFIYGYPVSKNTKGVFSCKLKTSSKPGKYYVPVKINYITQDSVPVTNEVEIIYTVANIQNQE